MDNSNQYTNKKYITVVSGLPRSGTSMMMSMLQAGGMELLTDNIRTPNEDNPKGYYEIEKVKRLKDGEDNWLSEAEGKAIKVISALLEFLPDQYNYRVIFMRRDIEEILASQKKMLIRRNEPVNGIDDEKMGEVFTKHLSQVSKWLADKQNFKVVYLNYKDLLSNVKPNLVKLRQELDIPLDLEPMLRIPDQGLYRQRRSEN